MDIGVVLQCTPPAARVVELARLAETHGFSHVWTFDSHLLWQEPYVIHSQILAATRKVVVGPMVTNPATRDWTVTASTFATLNDMFGNRTLCGIGRGDSAVRTLGGKPATLATLRESVEVIRELGNGRSARVGDTVVRLPWAAESRLEVWVAGYGPRVLDLAGAVADGFILQLADPDITAWTIARVRAAAERVGRDPASVQICAAAPAYVTDGSDAMLAHARQQCRWFGAMVGNHVADIVSKYGTGTDIPAALTDFIQGRQDYDYNQHGRAGNVHAEFVPDTIVDRFCLLGTPDDHLARLRELERLGVDQFAVYLQHDAKTATLQAYGESVLPRLTQPVIATEAVD
ncbi:TIGR03842 family LLM class F420-dependent oxidoreductase [Nocardia sp. NPDC049220]|uniref:TIGR03842 family LLM class F420-dependent oxidoreductase n=1 Tax=Nocardia sp. NPDC049220 TaxID=3155273 RepID=UPI0033DD4BA5